MNKLLLILLLIPSIVSAEIIVTYDSRFNTAPNSNFRSVDVSSVDNSDMLEMKSSGVNLRAFPSPSLVDIGNKIAVAITGTLHQAAQDLKALRAARDEQRSENKDARREWRQVRRDIATALGQPATNGPSWSISNSYTMVQSVTNANTRQDLNLRLIQADYNQTRYQMQKLFPENDWWFDRTDDE